MEFYKDGSMEPKIYLSNCAVNGPNKRPIILITHNKSTFLANDNWHLAWLMEGDVFLRPKKREKNNDIGFFIILEAIKFLSFRAK